MVFKVVILKIKKGKSKLLSPSIKYIKKYFSSFFLSSAISNRNKKHNASNEFPKILINNKYLYISPIYYPYVFKINAT